MADIVIRLYYRLKNQRSDSIEQYLTPETLKWSTNFRQWLAFTEHGSKNSDKQAYRTKLSAHVLPQAEYENATFSFAALELQIEDAFLSSVFGEHQNDREQARRLIEPHDVGKTCVWRMSQSYDRECSTCYTERAKWDTNICN